MHAANINTALVEERNADRGKDRPSVTKGRDETKFQVSLYDILPPGERVPEREAGSVGRERAIVSQTKHRNSFKSDIYRTSKKQGRERMGFPGCLLTNLR